MLDLIPAEVTLTEACKTITADDHKLSAATAFVTFLEKARTECARADAIADRALRSGFVQVIDTDTCAEAQVRVRSLKDAHKNIEDGLNPITSEIHSAFMTLSGRKTTHLKAIDNAVSEQSKEIVRYKDELQRAAECLSPWEDAPETPKVEGLQERNTPWKVEFGTTPQERRLALKKLVAKAATDDSLLDYLDFNESAVKAFAKRAGEAAMTVIPGIHVYRDKVLARAGSRKQNGGEVRKVITLVPVTSSQISAVGYDGDTETLRVQFSSGSQYDYSNVESTTFAGLLDAESAGKYFNQNIKNKFASQKVGE